MNSPSDARAFEDAMAWLSSFTDWEQKLHLAEGRSTFDLSRMETLLARLGAPHQGRPVVHVTGTKGKSSVVLYTDALLRAAGHRTLRFVSPHVRAVHERLSLNGQDISDGQFAKLAQELRRLVEAAEAKNWPSFFSVVRILRF